MLVGRSSFSTVIANGSSIGLYLTHRDEGSVLDHTGREPINYEATISSFSMSIYLLF